MAKANTTWTVIPHRPIEKLARSVWRVEGDLPGMPLKRVMTIAKRADGRLVIHNAIALDDAAMKEIEAWGEVGFLVVPNGYHRLDAKVFKDRYPNATVLCPRGSRKRVLEVVAVDGAYEDFPKDPLVSLETLEGVANAEGAMIVRDEDGTTLVLNDAVFNMPHRSGFTGFVFKHVTQSSGGPKLSRIARWFLVKDAKALRASLERLADLPALKRVIVSHHETIVHDPARTLREVAATL